LESKKRSRKSNKSCKAAALSPLFSCRSCLRSSRAFRPEPRGAAEYPARKNQQDGPEALKKRLGADVKEFKNGIFDTCSNESLVRAACKPIEKSGKKKSNLMASLSLMHPKYKDELEKDFDLEALLYRLLDLAGINSAFMNFYPTGGQFNFHRE
jgi:hypothetical protein